MLFLTLALLNLTSNLPRTIRFLKALEASESPSYINVIRFENHSSAVELLNELDQPKIVLDNSSLVMEKGAIKGLNYLNLPFNHSNIQTLKFYFNRSVLTVISIDKVLKLPWDLINRLLVFTKLSTILIISGNEDSQELNKTMSTFYKSLFINVLHLDIGTFEDTQMITTYESFPKYQLVSRHKFKKDEVNNIRMKEISVAFLRTPPYSFYINRNNTKEVAGIIGHFYKEFVRFVNGTLIEDIRNGRTLSNASSSLDFVANSAVVSLATFVKLYPTTTEIFSDDIDFSDILVLIPKAKPIEKKLYLVKIFAPGIWISTLFFIFYASAILSAYEVITRKKTTFWRTFCQLFRSSLGQSFPYPTTFNMLSMFYMITVFFGFILTVWFSAILGSFVTTTLIDKQARTLEDLRMQNIKIAIQTKNRDLEMFYGFNEIQDLTVNRKIQDEDAVLVPSDVWHYAIAPVMFKKSGERQYIKSDIIVERAFLRVPLPYQINSIYKSRINRFIGLIKDYGIYLHWHGIVPWEIYEYQGKPYYARDEECSVHVLQLDFLVYPFWVWSIGLIFSCISFLLEFFYSKVFCR